jgi:RNA polymerase sigma-70 factor (ECF subfamily)
MPEEPSFVELMDRLRRGDAGAAEDVFRRYARRLIGLARRRLDARVRRQVDPEDVALSALKSFFTRQARGAYDLDGWDSLWSLLTLITLRKCGHQTRHLFAARRDVRREVAPPADDSDAGWQALARGPTPSEAALLAEAVEHLLRGLDPGDREVVQLSLQGYKAAEISARAGVAERTVYRLLERVKGRLQRLAGADAAAP